MGRTVAELESSLGSSEFDEWVSYYELEPFGAWRDNLHSAQIASTLHNINRRKNAPAKTAKEWMYEHPDEKRINDTAQTLAAFKAMAKRK